MNAKLKGYLLGIGAAVSYGTNPLGALKLYDAGANVGSVLFFRYSLAVLAVLSLLLLRGENLKIQWGYLLKISFLGILFGFSSISLYSSFHYMDAGIASTLLFVYPVMVAVIMAVFFHEKVTLGSILSILFALSGIVLLYKGEGNISLSTIGVILVMISSLTYAVYMVAVNRWKMKLSALKLTFYVMLFSTLTITIYSCADSSNSIVPFSTAEAWMWGVMLALLPTFISILLINEAIRLIGSTPTAILGALEPLTAVAIGVIVFGESLTPRLSFGIVLILTAVILVVLSPKLGNRNKDLSAENDSRIEDNLL